MLPALAAAASNPSETVGHLRADHVEHVGFHLCLLADLSRESLEFGRVEVRLLGRILQQPAPFRVDDFRQAGGDELAQRVAFLDGRRGGIFIVASRYIRERGRDTARPADRYPGRSRIGDQPRIFLEAPAARPNASQAKTELTARMSRTTAKPAAILVPIERLANNSMAELRSLVRVTSFKVNVRLSAADSAGCASARRGRCSRTKQRTGGSAAGAASITSWNTVHVMPSEHGGVVSEPM